MSKATLGFWITVLLGVTLSTTTFLLKLVPTPCLSGNCSAVIQSAYGAIAGIPVSIFGLLGWALVLQSNSKFRLGAIYALLGGSVYFIAVQYWILGQFCVFCTLHAFVCFALLPYAVSSNLSVPSISPRVYGFGLLMGGAMYAANTAWVEQQMITGVSNPFVAVAPEQVPNTAQEVKPQIQPTVLPVQSVRGKQPEQAAQAPDNSILWLSDQQADGFLVLSVSCPHCITLMDSVILQDFSGKRTIPLVFQTNEHNFEKTAVFLAAILSGGSPSESFPFAFGLTQQGNQSLLLTGDADTVKAALQPAFPNLTDYLDTARQLLSKQKAYLQSIGNPGTPMLFTKEGISPRVTPEKLTQQ